MPNISHPELIIAIALTVILTMTIISFRILGRRWKAVEKAVDMILPESMPAEGVEIPLVEAASGLKALAPVTFAHTNIGPKLILYENRFDYKVFFKRSALYSDIESLRVYRSRFFNRLTFKFFNSNLFVSFALPDEHILGRIVQFLSAKGVYPDEKSRL